MNEKNFAAVLKSAGVEQDGDWSTLHGERTMTLHLSHDGVGLNLSKIRKVRVEGELVFAEGVTEEVSVTHLKSLFAIAIEGESKATRKAGFR